MLTTRYAFRAALLAVTMAASYGVLSTARAADVAASDKMPASYGAMMKMEPADVMHLMDPDKKGFVTKKDYMKFHEAMFDKMDKDKDGRLNEREWFFQSSGG